MTITNAQYAKVFNHAKKYLAKTRSDLTYTDKVSFICWAIIDARNDQHITAIEADCARKLIDLRLGIHCEVKHWLLVVAGVPENQLTYEAVQTYRLEWLDQLIKEFSE